VALNDRGILVEVSYQLAEIGVLVNAIATPLGESFEFPADLFLAPRRTNDDAIGVQLLFVVEKITHADRGRSEKAVPARRIARRNPRHRELQRLASENGDNPSNGTKEARAFEPRQRHRSQPGQTHHRR